MNVRLIKFPRHTDKYGNLVPIEENRDAPFEIRRVYYIYGVEQGVRGSSPDAGIGGGA